jgi:Predicted membrane protein (DUF2085)
MNVARAIVLASLLWPVVLGGAVAGRSHGAVPVWTSLVYFTASTLCHQKPARSFQTADVTWPVCARCSGLYLSAPFGAVAGLASFGLGLEWMGVAAPSNLVRAASALPLGAAIAFVLVRTAAEGTRAIR